MRLNIVWPGIASLIIMPITGIFIYYDNIWGTGVCAVISLSFLVYGNWKLN